MGVISGPKIHNVQSKPDRYTQLLIHGGGADGTQTFTDSSIYNRTISYQGNAQWEASDAAGVHFFNSTIEFDGTGDYLTSSAFNFLQNKWTVECWFYYDTSFPGTVEGLIALDYDGSSGSTNNAMNLTVLNGEMALYVSSSVGSGWNVVNGTTGGTVAATTWHHAAAVFDGSTYKVYLNGDQVISVSSSVPTASSDNSRIIVGTTADSNSGQSWNGYIDEIRVSSIARYTENFTPSGPFNVDRLVLSLDSTGGYKTGPELLTSGTSGQRAATYGYHQSGDIFDNATMTGFHAKHASSGQANAGSPVTLPLLLGKTYRVRFDCNIISGTGSGRPNFNMSRHYNYGSMTTDKVNRYRVQEGSDPYYTSSAVQGKNEFIVTVTTDPTWGNSCIQFSTFGAQEYTISNMSVKELFPYNDLSSGGNTGTPAADAILAVEGYVSATVWPDPATPRYVWTFDGTGDYINVGDIGDVFGTSFTISMWINSADVSNRKEFIGQYVDSNNWWRFGNDELGNWEIDVQDGGSRTVSVNPDWSVVVNQWHHIVLSRNASDWRFYKNGEEDGTGSDASTLPDMAAPVHIGNSTGGAYFNGKISAVQIYKTPLTHAQIKNMYNSQRSRFGL
tara:strand:+ start:3244 stop:5094 length:1851 start_codon:yes stop_codon:yes gene_type:complete